jgi:hypothetical protein
MTAHDTQQLSYGLVEKISGVFRKLGDFSLDGASLAVFWRVYKEIEFTN